MAVAASGAIDLDEFHQEAGGSANSNCSINDADIRALISKSDGATMAFNEWYGAEASRDQALSSIGTITTDRTFWPQMAFDTNSNRVVIVYGSQTASKMYAQVGTVSTSENTMSWGTRVEVEGGGRGYDMQIAFDSNVNKFLVVYSDKFTNAQRKLVAKVGTVNDTTITFGSAATITAAGNANQNSNGAVALAFDSNVNKFLILYQNPANTYQEKYRVAEINGTSVTLGNQTAYGPNYGYDNRYVKFDSNANKLVMFYREGDNPRSRVATISNNTCSFGTEYVIDANLGSSGMGSGGPDAGMAFDSNSNKVLCVWNDSADSSIGHAAVGTVSGTNISFGTVVEYEQGSTTRIGIDFDSNVNKFLIAYTDGGDGGKGKLIIATISGTDVSFGSPILSDGNTGNADYSHVVFDSNAKRFVVALSTYDSGYATEYKVFQMAT